jgi:hypothetical protein
MALPLILLGIILLVLGYALAISILYILGVICLVVGVVLYLAAALGGRRGPP